MFFFKDFKRYKGYGIRTCRYRYIISVQQKGQDTNWGRPQKKDRIRIGIYATHVRIRTHNFLHKYPG